jgi:primosomal protein N' (replication factor Y)
MRQELKAGNRSIFSRDLQAALQQVLERGSRPSCSSTGAAQPPMCFAGTADKACSAALRYPADLHSLLQSGRTRVRRETGWLGLTCHHCGYHTQLPEYCPNCGSQRIRRYGTGTERVEAELQALLPGVRTLRWDYGTTRSKGAHEIILSHFQNQRADVLVGTQMLAKGLDLPLVTMVGVVLAEVGLNLPDYRAGERTFNLLTQVAGRAGRSPLGGQVILQTFAPEHYAIQAAARHDYEAFYQELAYRRNRYPPFTLLVRLEYHHPEHQGRAGGWRAGRRLTPWIATQEKRATQ